MPFDAMSIVKNRRPDAKDQMCLKKLIVVLEFCLLRFQNQIRIFMFLKYSQEVFIIPVAGVTTKIMCYLCSRMSPRWKDEYLGKGKVNPVKIEIEVLKMGIVLATKEAHFVCKSKCYGGTFETSHFPGEIERNKAKF